MCRSMSGTRWKMVIWRGYQVIMRGKCVLTDVRRVRGQASNLLWFSFHADSIFECHPTHLLFAEPELVLGILVSGSNLSHLRWQAGGSVRLSEELGSRLFVCLQQRTTEQSEWWWWNEKEGRIWKGERDWDEDILGYWMEDKEIKEGKLWVGELLWSPWGLPCAYQGPTALTHDGNNPVESKKWSESDPF